MKSYLSFGFLLEGNNSVAYYRDKIKLMKDVQTWIPQKWMKIGGPGGGKKGSTSTSFTSKSSVCAKQEFP